MFTLWFWFKGAPEKRPGGPWWHKSFDSERRRNDFLCDVVEFLHAYGLDVCHMCKGPRCQEHTLPAGVELVFVKDRRAT